MAALGIGGLYAAYCMTLWGVCLVTGKNVGIKQLFGPWPPNVPSAVAQESNTNAAELPSSGGTPAASAGSAGSAGTRLPARGTAPGGRV